MSTSIASADANKRTIFSPLGRKMMLPAIIILSFFMLVVYVSLKSIARMQDQFEKVVEIDAKALQNVTQLSRLVHTIEAEQKTYVITGNDDFFNAYKSSQKEFFERLEQLKTLANEDQQQLEQLEQIELLINLWEQKVAIPENKMGRTINQGAVGAEYLQYILKQGKGKRISDEIRIMLNKLRQQFQDGDIRLVKSRYWKLPRIWLIWKQDKEVSSSQVKMCFYNPST